MNRISLLLSARDNAEPAGFRGLYFSKFVAMPGRGSSHFLPRALCTCNLGNPSSWKRDVKHACEWHGPKGYGNVDGH